MTNKLNVLIVEDDENDSKALAAEVNANSDKLCLADVLKSSDKALEFIRNNKPHAVILDLELTEGIGDGFDLLDKLNSTLIYPRPYIIVNTNNPSKTTRDAAEKKGADYTFVKWQKGYSPKMVINQLLFVMPSILGCEEEPPEPLTERQLENKMRDFVQSEFNKLGIKAKNKGYKYLVDAVILAAKGENNNWDKIIGEKYKQTKDSVKNAMKYLLDTTWSKGDVIALTQNYPGRLPENNGAPTTCEFVFLYKQKLISYLNN